MVNCLDRLASRWEEVRSRRDFILAGGEGGKGVVGGDALGVIVELFTSGQSFWAWLSEWQRRLGGGVGHNLVVELPSSEGGGVITPEYRWKSDMLNI